MMQGHSSKGYRGESGGGLIACCPRALSGKAHPMGDFCAKRLSAEQGDGTTGMGVAAKSPHRFVA
jgi:hypothetical protein